MKRFTVHQNRPAKVVSDIDSPFILDIFDTEHPYKLKGFIMHIGGYMGGHYYAYCKNYIDNIWREYNDTNVHQISSENVFCASSA